MHPSSSQGLQSRHQIEPKAPLNLDSSPSKSVASPIRQLPESYKQADSSQKWDLILFHDPPQYENNTSLNLLLQNQQEQPLQHHEPGPGNLDHHGSTLDNDAIQSTLRAIVEKQELELKICSPLSNSVAAGANSASNGRREHQREEDSL